LRTYRGEIHDVTKTNGIRKFERSVYRAPAVTVN